MRTRARMFRPTRNSSRSLPSEGFRIGDRWRIIAGQLLASTSRRTGANETTNVTAIATPHDFGDASLVARLQAGDGSAFETLVRTYTAPLLRVARRFMKSEEDARDALQEAFISVFKSIGRFESGSRLSTWLHRIVVNSCLMKLRSQRRRPEEDIEQY